MDKKVSRELMERDNGEGSLRGRESCDDCLGIVRGTLS